MISPLAVPPSPELSRPVGPSGPADCATKTRSAPAEAICTRSEQQIRSLDRGYRTAGASYLGDSGEVEQADGDAQGGYDPGFIACVAGVHVFGAGGGSSGPIRFPIARG